MSIRKLILFTLVVFLCYHAVQAAFGAEEAVYRVAINSSRILKFDKPFTRVAVGSAVGGTPTGGGQIVDYNIVSKDELLLIGLKVGRTELHIWSEKADSADQYNEHKTYLVFVYDDIFELKNKMIEVMGSWIEKAVSIHVVIDGNNKRNLILKGIVNTVFQSEQIEKIAAFYSDKVLNLIEIKAKEEKAVVSKTMEPPKAQKMASPTDQAASVPAPAVSQPAAVNQTDIVELDALEKIRMTDKSYGPAPDANFVQEKPVSSETISRDAIERANTRTTRIVVLQNSVAKDVATILNSNGIKSADGQILSDERTNSIIVVDKPYIIEKIVNMIKVLDSEVSQVLIEAKIVEVDLTDNMSNTMTWIYETIYGNVASGMNNKTFTFDNSGLSMKVDYGKINSDHFNSTILPKLNKLHARLLSSPSTITLDRKKAIFFVKDKIPYLVITQQVNNGIASTSNSTQFVEPEIRLEATPIINQSNHIKLDMHVKVETFIGLEKLQDGSSAPKTNVRDTTNIVEVKNNETVIISGFIQNRVNRTASKVPFISKIPLVGTFFSNKNNENVRTELVIFVTPRIIGKDSRYGKVDKEKYPKVAENKYPNVDEKFDMSELLNDEEHPAKKTVNSDYEIPKAMEILPPAPVKETVNTGVGKAENVIKEDKPKEEAPVIVKSYKLILDGIKAKVAQTAPAPSKNAPVQASAPAEAKKIAPSAEPLKVAAPAAEPKKAAAPAEPKKAAAKAVVKKAVAKKSVKRVVAPAKPITVVPAEEDAAVQEKRRSRGFRAEKLVPNPETKVDNSPIRDPRMQALIEMMRRNLVTRKAI